MDEPPPTPESVESTKKSNRRGIMWVVSFAIFAFSILLRSLDHPRFDTSNIPTVAPGIPPTFWPDSGHEFQAVFKSPPVVRQDKLEGGGATGLVQTAELIEGDLVMQAQLAPLVPGTRMTRAKAEAQAAQTAQVFGLKGVEFFYSESMPGFPTARLTGSREVLSPPAVSGVLYTYQIDFHYGTRERLLGIVGEPSRNFPSTPGTMFLLSIHRTR